METPSHRYREVSHRVRELARSEASEVLPDPATPEEVSAAERALDCRFPDSYRWFQLEFGDFAHGPLDIYSVRGAGLPIVGINLDARRTGYPRLPPHLIALSDSGALSYGGTTRGTQRNRLSAPPPAFWIGSPPKSGRAPPRRSGRT